MYTVGSVRNTPINSALALTHGPTRGTLPNFGGIGPRMCTNLFPMDSSSCRTFHSTLNGLDLGSTSLFCRPRDSDTLNFNFHYNFLNLLRVRVVRRHLRHRCSLSLVAATPAMICRIRAASERIVCISDPSGLPTMGGVCRLHRPVTRYRVLLPRTCLNGIVALYMRGHNIRAGVICRNGRITLACRVPVTRIILSFFSHLGSASHNCTSLSCGFGHFRTSSVMHMSMLVGNRHISTLTLVARHSGSRGHNHRLIRGVGSLVPHRRFSVTVRTTVNARVVTQSAIGRLHGGMLTGYCNNSVDHGGGLLRGRGRNGGHVGRVNGIRLPRRTFLTVLRINGSGGWPLKINVTGVFTLVLIVTALIANVL